MHGMHPFPSPAVLQSVGVQHQLPSLRSENRWHVLACITCEAECEACVASLLVHSLFNILFSNDICEICEYGANSAECR